MPQLQGVEAEAEGEVSAGDTEVELEGTSVEAGTSAEEDG